MQAPILAFADGVGPTACRAILPTSTCSRLASRTDCVRPEPSSPKTPSTLQERSGSRSVSGRHSDTTWKLS